LTEENGVLLANHARNSSSYLIGKELLAQHS